MKIKKDDNIIVITGKDRNKKGKVIKALHSKGKIVVENINIAKKHRRPRKEGEKGQVVEFPSALDVSNVKLICPKCGKSTRVGYKLTEGGKFRICKKCNQEI
jgi:large subunit ribosomal protein L24